MVRAASLSEFKKKSKFRIQKKKKKKSVQHSQMYGLILGSSCVEPGVVLIHPCKSLPTWGILWFCSLFFVCLIVCWGWQWGLCGDGGGEFKTICLFLNIFSSSLPCASITDWLFKHTEVSVYGYFHKLNSNPLEWSYSWLYT